MADNMQNSGNSEMINTVEEGQLLCQDDVAKVFTTLGQAHTFMTVEADRYLPKKQYCSLKWLAEICNGSRKVSKSFTCVYKKHIL